jgi:hypothetical protein
MSETVRFSAVMAACGTPEVYLPLADPRRDKAFLRAVREQRVVTLKQEPTGTRKDFGVIGFHEEKHVSYLIFPRPLAQFKGQRVVGIKYDVLRQAPVATPRAPAGSTRRAARPSRKAITPKPVPKPQRFVARVRVTAKAELEVTVRALNQKEARARAREEARARADFSAADVETNVRSLEKEPAHGG